MQELSLGLWGTLGTCLLQAAVYSGAQRQDVQALFGFPMFKQI